MSVSSVTTTTPPSAVASPPCAGAAAASAGPVCFSFSGKRGALFQALVDKKILDAQGRITDDFSARKLPSLTQAELALIKKELGRMFPLSLDEKYHSEASMTEILSCFLHEMKQKRPDICFPTAQLIGGYVFHFLFTKTDYANRVFQELELTQFYDRSLLSRWEKAPADLDLRLRVEKRPRVITGRKIVRPLLKEDLGYIRTLISEQLSRKFIPKLPPEEAVEKVREQVYSELCLVDTGFLKMLLMSLKGSSIDLNFCHQLSRDYILTEDDLFIPLFFLISTSNLLSTAPESHRGKPLESFLHAVLGFTATETISTIVPKTWMRYVSRVTRGNCLIQPGLEPIFYAKVKQFSLWEDIEDWIVKHHADDPLMCFCFLINSVQLLLDRRNLDEIQEFVRNQTPDMPVDAPPIALSFHALIQNSSIPLRAIIAVMKVGAYYASLRKSSVHIEQAAETTLHVPIGRHTLQFDTNVVEAIAELESVDPQFHKELAPLFFHMCPPISNHFESPTRAALRLMDSDFPFLEYIGLMTVFGDSEVPAEKKRAYAERQLVASLKLVEDEQKEALKKEFELYIGKGVIPELDDPDFQEKWVEALFQYGRGSEARAFECWIELPSSAHTFKLIERLAHHQPLEAMRLLMHTRFEDFPEAAAACVMACASIADASPEQSRLQKYLKRGLLSRASLVCYQKNIPLPSRANRAWYAVLTKWCAEASPDLQLIQDMVLYGSRQKLKATSDLYAVKLRLAEAYPKRSFPVLCELVHAFPDQIDRARYYALLGVYLESDSSGNPKTLRLLDQLAQKDPHPCYDELIEPLLALCVQLIEKPFFVSWITKTSLFNALEKRDRYQSFLETLFLQLINGECQKGQLKAFTLAHIHDLRNVRTKIWEQWIAQFLTQAEEPCVKLYDLLEKNGIFREENEAFFALYISALKDLIDQTSPQFALFLDQLERHKRYCSKISQPDLVLMGHSCIMEGAVQSVDRGVGGAALVEQMREIHLLSQKVLRDLRNQPNSFPGVCDKIEAAFECYWIYLLLASNRRAEGRTQLDRIFGREQTRFYWQQMGLLLNRLVKHGPLFLNEIDRILRVLNTTPFEDAAIPEIVSVLLANPSKERYQRAGQLLRYALADGQLKPGAESWRLIYPVLMGLVRMRAVDDSFALTVLFKAHYGVYQKEIGELFQLQSWEVILRNWFFCRETHSAHLCMENIQASISAISTVYRKKGGKELFSAFPYALVGLSYLSFRDFNSQVDYFIETVVVRKQGRRLALPVDDCFAAKRKLIELMINALDGHPHKAELEAKTKALILLLMRDPDFKNKKQEITELLSLLRSGGSSAQPPSD
ncbi:MAG: hypothetical protein S4CHLAM2_00730 [Chlamydiales bacterium]|nr:hypothetical protein [Chlamydiales bacterium]